MGGSVKIGSAVYPVSTWSVNVSNDVQDCTDTGSNGWVAVLAGVSSAEVSFTAFWGSATAQLSTAFAIGSSVSLTLDIGNGADTVTGTVIIASFVIANPAKNPVTFECTGKSNGAFTFPT